jgi:hypothetical protein
MNCDDFLPLLATGGWLGRWRARRHARRCSRCAAAARLLRELRADEPIAPLPPHLRQSWLATTKADSDRLATRRQLALVGQPLGRIAAALAVAVSVLLLPFAIGRWWAQPAVNQPAVNQPAPVQHQAEAVKPGPVKRDGAGEIVITTIEPAAELARLREQVARLAGDVERLADVSRRLETERQINELLARHSSW